MPILQNHSTSTGFSTKWSNFSHDPLMSIRFAALSMNNSESVPFFRYPVESGRQGYKIGIELLT